MAASVRSPGPVVVAPAPFKGAISAAGAAAAISTGLRLALPDVEIRQIPVADGGEGTLQALVDACHGRTLSFDVADPLGRPAPAMVGLLPGGTAVVELAQASGYERLSVAERDPEATSTYGTGQLIREALGLSPRRIVVTVGGSATNDGGLGLLRALGARILDSTDTELEGRGADLSCVAAVDLSQLDARLTGIPIHVACDVRNPFFGATGAAHVFASQKGADIAAVERLDAGLRRFAAVVSERTGLDLQSVEGSGAAGGVAGGMVAFLGAEIVRGADLVLDAVGFDDALDGAAWCITGEGRLDEQTLDGKAPAAVASRCRDRGVPCVGVCGELRLLPGQVRRAGMVAAFPVRRVVGDLETALASTEPDLAALGAALGGVLGTVSAQAD